MGSFHWSTTTSQCWSGVLKLRSSEVSWFWGCGMLNLLDKLPFQRKLCYPAFHKAIWLRKKKPFWR